MTTVKALQLDYIIVTSDLVKVEVVCPL